ncbi:hypothetical protein D3OALGA1CA_3682 [Olavius algarvensis associated proteobacterium Delta 3]|nr:hypothetical protein D3OALGA1CA_3682 [Olavius algarvensis associated proteobacterium Delta 3]CAB5148257.1 hypothetical protein D3OALGB2SA_4643 [Olavius algarvensis associated proteobacterium Delta 3]
MSKKRIGDTMAGLFRPPGCMTIGPGDRLGPVLTSKIVSSNRSSAPVAPHLKT